VQHVVRRHFAAPLSPDYASLHPGYGHQDTL
jgi:hypothetical protein